MLDNHTYYNLDLIGPEKPRPGPGPEEPRPRPGPGPGPEEPAAPQLRKIF